MLNAVQQDRLSALSRVNLKHPFLSEQISGIPRLQYFTLLRKKIGTSSKSHISSSDLNNLQNLKKDKCCNDCCCALARLPARSGQGSLELFAYFFFQEKK